MLDKYFTFAATLDRLRHGPTGDHLDGFTRYLAGLRYRPPSICAYVGAVQHLGTWLARRRRQIQSLDEQVLAGFERHLEHCGCISAYRGRPADTSSTAMQAARRFLEYMRARGIAAPARVPSRPRVVDEFCSWMRQHRGTADSTLQNYSRYVAALLATVGGACPRFSPKRLRTFVLRLASQHGGAHAQNVVKSVRMFIRFLVAEGKCRSDLDRAIPTMANWRLSSLPKYLPAADIERIIHSCDLRTKTGRRDHAVLLLLARLALRAGDVRALQLDDIDWDQGTIRVSGKNGRATQLPLPQEVGDALHAYIEHARPPAEYGAVFLRRIAPPRPLRAGALSGIVRWAILRSGVKAPSYGSHLLRHSAATEMLRQGASLDEIGSILRHSSIETTALYAKVDVNALRSIAQAWPQVQPC